MYYIDSTNTLTALALNKKKGKVLSRIGNVATHLRL